MRTRVLLLLALAGAAGCAPSLRLTRPTPSEASFGNVRTLSVEVSTDVKKAVETSVLTGMALGEIPVPVPMHAVVRNSLVEALQGLGFAVCPAAPCGDGALTAVLTESGVGTELTRNGPQANARITAKVKVRQNDGVETYDYSFWSRRSGLPSQAPLLVKDCADLIAERMRRTLVPGRERVEIPLEDGGPLSMGVNMLLSGNWGGAAAYFTDLVHKQPDLAGAWYDLGVAFEAQDDWGQALAAYEQAAALDRNKDFLQAAKVARRRAPPPGPPAPSAPPPAPAAAEPPPPPPAAQP